MCMYSERMVWIASFFSLLTYSFNYRKPSSASIDSDNRTCTLYMIFFELNTLGYVLHNCIFHLTVVSTSGVHDKKEYTHYIPDDTSEAAVE